MNELQTTEQGGVERVADIERQVQTIQLAMKNLMKNEVHYGKIPGCGDKPALLKAGAEKLLFMFRYAPKFEIETTHMDGGHREVTITAIIYDRHDCFVGTGIGSCSTLESKYRWRNAGKTCPDCGFVGGIFTSKAEYGGGYYCNKGKGGCGKAFKVGTDGCKDLDSQTAGKVENPDIADQYNTVLKMAKKRALVDACLTVTAASDVFEQDLDEYTEEQLAEVRREQRPGMKPKTEPPQEKKKTEPKKTAAKKKEEKDPEPEKEEDTDKLDLTAWKELSNKQDDVAGWWSTAHVRAKDDLGEKLFRFLENYIADVHSIKL